MWEIYISTCTDNNAYGHQTSQSGHILWGPTTHEFPWPLNKMVLWRHVTNKIYISTFRRPIDTKLGKVLTHRDRLPPLTLCDTLDIKYPTWSHMNIWKIHIYTFPKLMATKRGRVLTSRRRFSSQVKLSPTSWFFLWIQSCHLK